MEKDKSIKNNEVVDKNVIEPSELNEVEPIEEEMEDRTDNESIGGMKEELTRRGTKAQIQVEMPMSQHIGYYLKHQINEKIIEGLVDNHKYNDSLLVTRLGTPFLMTAKTEIRFDKETITLKSRKNEINFFKIPESSCKIKKKTKEETDPIIPINIMSRRILEWEERIKYHQEKEMGFNQWRIKVFDVECLTSKKEDSDVIFDEEKLEIFLDFRMDDSWMTI
uniref:Uncharacterized protein n=1 Tax=Tanacetum cinerariifolium TaxID=118510 RepID=A0A699HRP5_TANCI|nr:hypothetical protein [Tanacetum cinerariifolium]